MNATAKPIKKTKTNAEYLSDMEKAADALNNAEGIDRRVWAEQLKYIRINGSGLRPISICNDNPCGALKGHKTGMKRVTGRLLGALTAPAMPLAKNAKKPELRLQARLIEHALRTPENLPKLLHLEQQCDDLWLVTDELKVNDVRADVVLLAMKGDVYFPVFIELKNNRSLDRLQGQLQNIVRSVGLEADARAAFERFAMVSQRKSGKFDFDRKIMVIIWPALAESSRIPDSTRERAAGYHILEFPKGYADQPLPRLGLTFKHRAYVP